ncbi:MAG: hypothetical protein IKR73_08480 [Oscillospiraceae bacterium]|nr:hypothetical protein [Oscillospiraceae bacterium]
MDKKLCAAAAALLLCACSQQQPAPQTGDMTTTLATTETSPVGEEENIPVEQSMDGLIVEDGKLMPILQYTDMRASDYTNDHSDILRYCVYVETDHDTDGDGKADLVKVLMQVPRAAAKGSFKAGTIYDPTPYNAGTVDSIYENDKWMHYEKPFDYDTLYAAGEKRPVTEEVSTLELAASADPSDWNYKVPYSGEPGFSWADVYDYYLVRGYAVAECAGIGTYGSEGFELCGMDLEMESHKAVVE